MVEWIEFFPRNSTVIGGYIPDIQVPSNICKIIIVVFVAV